MIGKIKKIIAFILVLVIGNTSFLYKVNSACENISNNAYQFAISFLNDYYLSIDQGEDVNVENYICDSNLLNYINNKIYAKAYKLNVFGVDDMQNYSVSYELKDENVLSDKVIYTIFSNVSFNYKNEDYISGYGEHIKISVSSLSGRYVINDIYSKYDDYDTDIRDINVGLDYEYRIITNDILDKQQQVNEKIVDYYDSLLKGDTKEFYECEEEKCTYEASNSEMRSLNSLNRNAMVTWADNNCSSNNPSSGNSSITYYYDFSEIAGNYDCTNFVSHSILAGGSVMYKTSNNGIDSNGWFFTNLNSRSSSWSGVSNLFNFLKNNTVKGPKGQKISYTDIYAPNTPYPYKAGDLLQFKNNNGIWRHSTLIVGYAAVGAGGTTLEAVVDGRTADGAYNYRQRQSTIYSGNARRVIVMKGYYN